MKYKSVDFSRVNIDSVDSEVVHTVINSFISKEINSWYELVKEEDYKGMKVIDNRVYILITSGEKKCGGYRVIINKIEMAIKHIRVYFTIDEPRENESMIASFVYPYELVVLNVDELKAKDVEKNYNIEFKMNAYL